MTHSSRYRTDAGVRRPRPRLPALWQDAAIQGSGPSYCCCARACSYQPAVRGTTSSVSKTQSWAIQLTQARSAAPPRPVVPGPEVAGVS